MHLRSLKTPKDLLIDWFLVFNATFSNISATTCATYFSGGRSRSTQREPPTMGKQLVNFITCGCESSAPFFVIYQIGREITPYWWYACMSYYVIQLPNSLSHLGPKTQKRNNQKQQFEEEQTIQMVKRKRKDTTLNYLYTRTPLKPVLRKTRQFLLH